MKDPESAQPLLGGRTPASFMSEHWQKKPLLIRHACLDFNGGISRDRLIALACGDDVESRLVISERGRFSLATGPFSRGDFRRLPASGWTLLVQGVNRVDAATDMLMRKFAFVPYARLDDVMISYATPGGGVGPHFDSYDVFLLQGSGRRRWRYGKQKDLTLVPDIDVKILRHFSPRHDAVLAAGDMLYLPPRIAHEGTAVDACITYSIGFRAATYTEIAQAFVDFLRDDVCLPTGPYADPDAKPSDSPARIDPAMLQRVSAALSQIRWDSRDVGRFLGCFLSEPKPIVRFSPPGAALGRSTFAAKAASRGLALDRATQLLYDDAAFYVNGEAVTYRGAGTAMLRRLADRRALSARECRSLGAPSAALLYQWYRYGFVHLSELPGRRAI
jgi:50S ribosomal protein L16 3-hydroxylase